MLISPFNSSRASRRNLNALAVVLAVVLISVLICGCGKKEDVKPAEQLAQPSPKMPPKELPQPEIPKTAQPGAVQWTFGSNAISLQIKADSQLNLFKDNPHTIVLCVYQLSDPNAYNDLAKDKEGIVKLLGCKRFGESVSGVERVILQPGEVRTVFLDRAVGAQYVALVAGYYDLKPEKTTLLFKIPVNVTKKGLIFKDTFMIPGRLDIGVFLGPLEMKRVGS